MMDDSQGEIMASMDNWKPYYLSAVQRCQRCGTRLAEPLPKTCPGCQNDLADVGIGNDFKEWEQQRQSGRTRFLVRALLFSLVVTAVGLGVTLLLKKDVEFVGLLIFGVQWPILGVTLAIMRWRWAERDYAEWKKRQPEGGPDDQSTPNSPRH